VVLYCIREYSLYLIVQYDKYRLF